MAQEQTGFDLLQKVADDLDMTFVAGRLWPPYNGQMWFGGRTLNDILLPNGSARQVALLVAPGGPPRDQIHVGHGVLDADGLARLALVAADMGGYVFQGRLALIAPGEWRQTHGASTAATSPRAQPDMLDEAADPLLKRARAAGWPPNFGDEPVLFLDEQPLYNLLATMSVGRDAVLLLGDIALQ